MSVYIYVIEQIGTGWVKIGIAANLDRRVRQLQTGSPNRLRIARAWGPTDRQSALNLEASLHEFFIESGGCGEWFSASPDDVSMAAMAIGGGDVCAIDALRSAMDDIAVAT